MGLAREGGAATVVEVPKMVTCGECGETFELSARNVRAPAPEGRTRLRPLPLAAEAGLGSRLAIAIQPRGASANGRGDLA